MKAYSQITFFYYDDMKSAAKFYEDIFHFELIQDQKKARIYRIGKSFFGVVDGKKGNLRAQQQSAALLTILVDSVQEWHEYLVSKNVKVIREPHSDTYIEASFYQDPGGYVIEIQRFMNRDVQKEFEQ